MNELKWWQKAVFYQIYPRSFADSNGDGIGDLTGIIQRLDHVVDLGVDAIWLSPHYPSPLFDCGYDISDYTGVAPEYGDMDDFRTFLAEAHRRGLRVILDFVLNHTSDQHPWFLESRSSRDNPKRDWYVWADGRGDGMPNNWESTFGGPAWEYDATTGQYYYHFFFKQQPDLNWRNPQVKEAMWNAVRFWLDMGVDGLRLDAIGTIFERADLADHTARRTLLELAAAREISAGPMVDVDLTADWYALFAQQIEQPGMHELMQELRAVIDEYDDRMLVGEAHQIAYHGDGNNELHLVFNFPLMQAERLTPAWIRANQQRRLAELAAISPDAWPCNTLGNHDSPRVKSRFGDGVHDDDLARVHLALMLTLRGTPFLYNGEEIGMTDLFLSNVEEFRDMVGVWAYHTARDVFHMPEEKAVNRAGVLARDRNRTPMQWENSANGGFSPAGMQTWLPVNPNYAQGINVADQQNAADSMLDFYRRMLRLRKQTPALIAGDYTLLHEDAEQYLAFLRATNQGESCLVVLNFSDQPHTLSFDLGGRGVRRLYPDSIDGALADPASIAIEPFGIYIGQLV